MPRLILVWLLSMCAAALGATQPQDLAGIAHVAFRVTDLEKARAFYGVLGFEQSFEFSQGDQPSVSYIKVNDRQFVELYQRFKDSDALGFMHICFESNGIDSLAKEYVKRGLDASVPRKAKAGNLLNAIHDPEGRLVEFTEYMPGSLHFEDRGNHLGERRVSEHLCRVSMPGVDPAALQVFYTSKLRFAARGSDADGPLRVPGTSGESVRFVAAQAGAQIMFDVENFQRTASDLSARGLQVHTEKQAIWVADPDGNAIAFGARCADERDGH
jgi:catechol 2,3-dioxygenase-like lactoylglutathione lyase family enzyme